MIQVTNISKYFTDKKRGLAKAVEDISFVCQPGKIFGLLGPNGAGKTTTLRMIATILEPTAGTVTVGGYNAVTQPGQVRGQIGYLTGDTGLYDRMTARETLQYFGELYGMEDDAIERRFDQLAQQFGMADFADRRVGKMSTGMKQKVSLARTVLHDPPTAWISSLPAPSYVSSSSAGMPGSAYCSPPISCTRPRRFAMRSLS
jgi:sodium transport system ATP-binding protein